MKKIEVQKSTRVLVYLFICLLSAGCDSLRFAPSEQQKQNAWLHGRTTTITADTAKDENASEQLQALTKLSESFHHPGPPKMYWPNLTSSLPARRCSREPTGRMPGKWPTLCWSWVLVSVHYLAAFTVRGLLDS
jgi:hypothetical protein